MIRALVVAAIFFTMTPLLIAIQWLLDKLGLPGWGFISCNYYKLLRALLRIKLHIVGTPVRGRAVLYVSNHVSWADIVVIGSLSPVAFVAKSEVRRWPLVGVTAAIERTVFVDRSRRAQTAEAIGEIVKRLKSGTSMVLFAEGTSSDGNRVLPFRSALLGAIEHLGAEVVIQPVSICYTHQHGIPMGRQHRPLVAWYCDLDFMPHIKTLIARGAVDAVVSYAEPIRAVRDGGRKALAKSVERTVRALTTAALYHSLNAAPAG